MPLVKQILNQNHSLRSKKQENPCTGLHRNRYLDDIQYQSIYNDCEELVKILVARCKKLNQEVDSKDVVKNKEMETW